MKNKLNILLAICCLVVLHSCGKTEKNVDIKNVTYNQDIAPLIKENCAACHHEGGVGPFSLTTFEQAKEHAAEMAFVTDRGLMPPWRAEPGYGEFYDERHLSKSEKSKFKAWLDNGMPQGSGQAPPPPVFDSPDKWQLGKPDIIIKMDKPFMVPDSGQDVYRCFVLPTNFKEDMYVQACEFHSGNSRTIHHCALFLDTTGQARALDARDPEQGYTMYGDPGFAPQGGLGIWGPGKVERPLPDGVGRLIRKNSDIVLQTHFNPTGKPEPVQISLGLYLCKEKPKHLLTRIPLSKFYISITPGAPAYEICHEFTMPVDTHILAIGPHGHKLMKEMKSTATLPGGKTEPLVWVRNYDFNWQQGYWYKDPVSLPRGTKVKLQAVYDNSQNNLSNPNHPSKRVYSGQNTSDEMFLCWYDVIVDNESERPKLIDYIVKNRIKFLIFWLN